MKRRRVGFVGKPGSESAWPACRGFLIACGMGMVPQRALDLKPSLQSRMRLCEKVQVLSK